MKQTNVGLAQFEDIVETFAHSQCLFCLLLGNLDNFSSHSFPQCRDSKNSSFYSSRGITSIISNRLEALDSRLSDGPGLARGSCCYRCLLPSRVCHRLKDLENKESHEECVYPWLVKAFIVICELRLEIKRDPSLLTALRIEEVELRSRSKDSTGILDYCRRPIKLFDTDAIEACRILNDLSIDKILRVREDREELNRNKRYRLST